MVKKTFKIKAPLATALNDTISAAKNYAGDLHVEIIPLRKLELDPNNPRDLHLTFTDIEAPYLAQDDHYDIKKRELETLASLANSIKEQGVLNPIIVYQHGDHYRLVAGERRSLASLLANKQDIPARVLSRKPDALKLSLLQWAENMERSDLSLWERLQNIEHIIKAFIKTEQISRDNFNNDHLINLLSCSRQQASCYQTLLNASPLVQQSLKNNHIKSIDKAVFIARAPKNQQERLLSDCIAGATLKQLKQTSTLLTSAQKSSKSPRKVHYINFGRSNKPDVAKRILQAVMKDPQLATVGKVLGEINWQNPKSVTNAFKQMIQHLEALEK